MFVIAGLGLANRAHASQSVELTWIQSTSPNIVGYKVYYGTQSHQYSSSITFASVSEATISGLADTQTYYFAVTAIDASGDESSPSGEAVYTTSGPVALDLQVQSTTAAFQAVLVSWTPSSDPGVYGYAVNYGTQSEVYTNSATYYGSTQGIIAGLAGGVTYYFAISPIDSYGVEAVASEEVSYTVPLPPSFALQAQTPADSPGVQLVWNAIQNEGIISYNVYYGTQSGVYTYSQNCGDLNSFLVRGLNPGQVYYFVVTAVDAYGDESPYSNEAVGTAAAAPGIQIQVQPATTAMEAVNVSWTPSADPDVYGYAVYYGTQSGVYNNYTSFYSGTEGMIAGLTAGLTYYFAIAPIDSFGLEPVASSEVSYTIPIPEQLVVQATTPANSPGVQLTWNSIQNEGIVGYNVYYGTQSGVYTASQSCGDVNTFVVLGLNPGQLYYFVVTSVDAYGNQSPYSNEATGTAAAPPPVQIQVQGTTVAMQAVNVSWTPSPDPDVYGYAVYYGTQSGVYENYDSFFSATNGVISGLDAGTTYYFAIAPIDSFGLEPVASGEVSYTIPIPEPLVVQATAQANPPGVELTWNAITNEGIVSYNVYYGTESGNYTAVTGCGDVTNFLVQGLNGGQTYYFAVTSVDGSGNESPFSEEASAVAPNPAQMILQTQTFTDDNGQPYAMEIDTPSTVYGNWEMDYSTDLQNWTPYTYGYGYGTGDGYDVDAFVSIDPTQPQVFFRVINY